MVQALRSTTALVGAFATLALLAAPAHAAPFNVTNNADSGPGSLRDAIVSSNLAGGSNTIVFASGLGTITLLSDLPIVQNNATRATAPRSPATTSSAACSSAPSRAAHRCRSRSPSRTSRSKMPRRSGGNGGAVAGGGAGLGGALFVANGANVTVSNVSLTSSTAAGGSINSGGGGGAGDSGGNGAGGGAGMGGAVFVQSGGSISFAAPLTVNGNSVVGGNAGGGTAVGGSHFGAGFFLDGSGTLTFSPDAAQTQTVGRDRRRRRQWRQRLLEPYQDRRRHADARGREHLYGRHHDHGRLDQLHRCEQLRRRHDHAQRRRPAMGDRQHHRHLLPARCSRQQRRHLRHQRQQCHLCDRARGRWRPHQDRRRHTHALGHPQLSGRDHDQWRHAGADRDRQHRVLKRREHRQCGGHLGHFREHHGINHHDARGRRQQLSRARRQDADLVECIAGGWRAAITSPPPWAARPLMRQFRRRASARPPIARPISTAAASRSPTMGAPRPIPGANWAPASSTWPRSIRALRSRIAWAHDWVSDPTLGAVFQALPGASFIVNGAAPAKNSALSSTGAELRLANGVTFLGKLDGEFASHAQTYAGTATVRYAW